MSYVRSYVDTHERIRRLVQYEEVEDVVEYQDVGNKADLCYGCDNPHHQSNSVFVSKYNTRLHLDDDCYELYTELLIENQDMEGRLSEYIESKEVTDEMMEWFTEEGLHMCYFCRYDVSEQWSGISRLLLPVNVDNAGGYVVICDRCTTLAQASILLRDPFTVHHNHTDDCESCGSSYPISNAEAQFRGGYKMTSLALCPVCYYKRYHFKSRHYRITCSGKECKETLFRDRVYDTETFDLRLNQEKCVTCFNKERYRIITETINNETYSAYLLPPVSKSGKTWGIQIFKGTPNATFSLPQETPIYGELNIPTEFDAYVTVYTIYRRIKYKQKLKYE